MVESPGSLDRFGPDSQHHLLHPGHFLESSGAGLRVCL